MMQKTNNLSEEKNSKVVKKMSKGFWVSVFAVIALVVTVLIIYCAVVLILGSIKGDGVGNYKGAEQELAAKAISDLKDRIDDKKRWAYTFHVDEVRPTAADEIIKYCTPNNGEVTNNPNNPRFYTVTITVGETADPDKKTATIDGCNAFGPKKDGAYPTR